MTLRRVIAVLAAACVLAGPAAASKPQPNTTADPIPLCDQQPERRRWNDPATPDKGRKRPIIAVHRGAAELAPENTLESFRGALAYEMEMIEVDVQQTADHRYVAFHDLDVARKTGASGRFPLLTFDQARSLNVANNDRWRGSAYDPRRCRRWRRCWHSPARTRPGSCSTSRSP